MSETNDTYQKTGPQDALPAYHVAMQQFVTKRKACENAIYIFIRTQICDKLPNCITKFATTLETHLGPDWHRLSKWSIDERVEDIREKIILDMLAEAQKLARAGRQDPITHLPAYVDVFNRAVEIAKQEIPDHASERNYDWLGLARGKLSQEYLDYRAKAVYVKTNNIMKKHSRRIPTKS